MNTVVEELVQEAHMEQATIRSLVRGGSSGALATGVMSAVMFAAQRAGKMGKLPPELITEEAVDAAGTNPPEQTQHLLAALNHVAYGVGCGVVYARLSKHLPPGLPSSLSGAAFGAVVWAGSYWGWIPAAGIMPPPPKDRPGRPASMFVAHLVFGAVLGALVGEPRRRVRSASVGRGPNRHRP